MNLAVRSDRTFLQWSIVALLLFTGSIVREGSIWGHLIVIFAVFVLCLCLMCVSTKRLPRECWRNVFIFWSVLFAIHLYGLLLTVAVSGATREALVYMGRWIPLYLIPIIPLIFTQRNDWVFILKALVLVGLFQAVYTEYFVLSGGLASYRAVVEEFIDVVYFYASVAVVATVFIVPMRKLFRLALIVILVIFLFRMGLEVSRTQFGGFLLAVGWALLFKVCHDWGWRKRIAWFATLMVVGVVGILMFQAFLIGTGEEPYIERLFRRFDATGGSITYRWTELSYGWAYGGVFGDGWGTSRDFGAAVVYTKASKALYVKPYIHNILAYFGWKLGVVGVILAIAVFVFVMICIAVSFRAADRLGTVVSCCLIVWLFHSSWGLVYLRFDMSIWFAVLICYFLVVYGNKGRLMIWRGQYRENVRREIIA